jgi:hypothetical protein
MPTIGIELCDAALRAAICTNAEVRLLDVADRHGATEWPGFAYHEGTHFTFGRAAEDMWFVHPRRVVHTFWSKLAHDSSSTFNVAGRPPSFSELAFFFLREYSSCVTATAGTPTSVVLAVPGSYLKDEATEEEKVGLLLGMAAELKLPLAGIVDMACAALCDPRAPGFNPTHPVIVVDVQFEGADLTLLAAGERLERKHFLHLPNSGYAKLLKHLTAAMGNRFLRHTAFDILEDGRVEQTFFRQTKDFLESGADEHRYQLNTATRNYEMPAKHEQLVADSQAFVTSLVQGLHSFIDHPAHAAEHCTIALTARTAALPGLEAQLRTAGFPRQLRLPVGAAAAGAARIGEQRLHAQPDPADVPVESSVPLADTHRMAPTRWEARLQKSRHTEPRLAPTHAILDGIGHSLAGHGLFTIGPAAEGANLPLPEDFYAVDDCIVQLVWENHRFWFVDPAPPGAAPSSGPAPRVAIEAGDRLTIRCGPASAEVLFAHCTMNGVPA